MKIPFIYHSQLVKKQQDIQKVNSIGPFEDGIDQECDHRNLLN